MGEVAENNRQAIVFSQWVEPLETLAKALAPFGPLQYHGKIAQKDRQPILDRFKSDKAKHVLLMSYGTSGVNTNRSGSAPRTCSASRRTPRTGPAPSPVRIGPARKRR
jgi:SNF2 family DNA or RNA helicase